MYIDTTREIAYAVSHMDSEYDKRYPASQGPIGVATIPRDLIRRIALAASRDKARWQLNSVRVDPCPDKPSDARICATDGKMLALARVPGAVDDELLWAPPITLAGDPLRKLLKAGPDVTVDHTGATTTDKNATLHIPPIEGMFPDYQWIVDRACRLRASLDDPMTFSLDLLCRASKILDHHEGVTFWRGDRKGQPITLVGHDAMVLVMPLVSGNGKDGIPRPKLPI